MSEPTYRVELTHHPECEFASNRWQAAVYDNRLDATVNSFHTFGETREEAFDKAQAWCRAKALAPEPSSTVHLTEDGDIIDRHEAGVLRDANA